MLNILEKNKDKADLFFSWIKSLPIKDTKKSKQDFNIKIMEVAEIIASEPNLKSKEDVVNYTKTIIELTKYIDENRKDTY